MGDFHRHTPSALLGGDLLPPEADLEAGSAAMRAFRRMLAHAAGCDVPVLLLGESGSGKTTFARLLHATSHRRGQPLVAVDCSAGVEDLSAQAASARTGTFFLDEVADLSPAGQVSALRLLEESAHPRLRVVASTRHRLEVEMAAGRFRRDLFYRLSVLELKIPPLRERTEDILPLARTFLESLALGAGRPVPQLTPELERALVAYSWPGNVVELRSVLEGILVLTAGDALDPSLLPRRMLG